MTEAPSLSQRSTGQQGTLYQKSKLLPDCISPTVHDPAVIGNLRVRARFFDSINKLSSLLAEIQKNLNQLRADTRNDCIGGCTLRASPTVPVELKLPVELNSFSDANRVCEPANESLF